MSTLQIQQLPKPVRHAVAAWTLVSILCVGLPEAAQQSIGVLAHPLFWTLLAVAAVRPWRWERAKPQPRQRRNRRGAQALRRARTRVSAARAA